MKDYKETISKAMEIIIDNKDNKELNNYEWNNHLFYKELNNVITTNKRLRINSDYQDTRLFDSDDSTINIYYQQIKFNTKTNKILDIDNGYFNAFDNNILFAILTADNYVVCFNTKLLKDNFLEYCASLIEDYGNVAMNSSININELGLYLSVDLNTLITDEAFYPAITIINMNTKEVVY